MQMSNEGNENNDSWRSPLLRRSVLQKITEAIQNSSNSTQRSPADMEKHIFDKATSKEEYLGFVARLLIHFKEQKNPRQPGQQQQQQQQQQMVQQQQPMNIQQQNSQLNVVHLQQQQQQQQQIKNQQQGINMAPNQNNNIALANALQQQQQMKNMAINMQQGAGVGNKMNMLNSGMGNPQPIGPNDPGSSDVPNMVSLKNAKQQMAMGQMGPQPTNQPPQQTVAGNSMQTLGGNNFSLNTGNAANPMNTNMISIANPAMNQQTPANIVLNSNMKQKMNLVTNNANMSNIAATHVNISQLQQQQQPNQTMQPNQQTLSLQQIQHHPQLQQQPNRMVQPNSNIATRMLLNQNIRQQQQPTQINLAPNMPPHLRVRQAGPNGNLQQAMVGMPQQQQQPNQPNTSLPIYIQQQQQPQGTVQQQPNQATGMVGQQPGPPLPQAGNQVYEMSQQRPQQTQPQFKPNILNANAPGMSVSYGNNFNANMPAGQQGIQMANQQRMNVAGPNTGPMMPDGSHGPRQKHPGPAGPQLLSNRLVVPQQQNQVLSGPNMINSPSNYHGSSPASNVMMPSPASRPPHSMESPSPQSCTLNTPVSVPPRNSVPSEDQLYREKLQSLQKYLDLFRNAIQQKEKEECSKEVSKMRNIYQIITGETPTTLNILEKCEKFFIENYSKNLIEKNQQQPIQPSHDCSPVASIPSVTSNPSVGPMAIAPAGLPAQGQGVVVTSNKIPDICQPLIDAVKRNFQKPMFVHNLHRIFGPAMAVLHPEPYLSTNRVNTSGNYVLYTNSNVKPKRKHSELDLLSDVLQGEIARLDIRFKVEPLTANKQNGSNHSQHLLCRLDDGALPCVPPIILYVTDKYPEIPPYCVLEAQDYDTSEYFRRIHKYFENNLLKLQGPYSLTSLLNTWERSVHQAVSTTTTTTTSSIKEVEKENILVAP